MRSLTPHEAARRDALSDHARPTAAYAIIRGAAAKPHVFPDMAALARWVLREKGAEGLDGPQATLFPRGDQPGEPAVALWTTDEGGGRNRFLGYAWFPGGKGQRLMDALHEIERNAEPHAVAA